MQLTPIHPIHIVMFMLPCYELHTISFRIANEDGFNNLISTFYRMPYYQMISFLVNIFPVKWRDYVKTSPDSMCLKRHWGRF